MEYKRYLYPKEKSPWLSQSVAQTAQFEDEFHTRGRVFGHHRQLNGHGRFNCRRCPKTRPRAGNSSSNLAVQDARYKCISFEKQTFIQTIIIGAL